MKEYWSCSKLADKIRGTKKPKVASSQGWDEWTKAAKESHPIRFWIADELLDRIQDVVWFIPDKYNAVRYYLNNRFLVKTHSLTAHKDSLKRGQWCDLSSRFLPCMFDSLVDFVECEKAGMQVNASDKDVAEKYSVPMFRRKWWLRFLKEWRCPQAGIDYLKWEMTLVYNEEWGTEPDNERYGKMTPQAEAAKEVLDLYTWYTQVYKNRPDPYDVSGWSRICEERRQSGDMFAIFGENNEARDKSLDLLRKIEEEYENEDTEMMIRLIKIRDSLWT